ncbi:MAG TPA: flagellar motor switch protein FliM, partial [Capsulimonadaceae bacterium]|nr:flagellar motor switch protein FliM [Capsulimonadaceae bacterium]
EMTFPADTGKEGEGARTSAARHVAERRASGSVFVPLSKRRVLEVTGHAPGADACELYDFRRPDKISKDQQRTLQVLHEAFARVFASTISGYLRTQVQIELVSIEQLPYEEYIRSISASLVNILNVSPLTGQMIYEVDLRILFVMLDRLLGGTGEGGLKLGKDITDIEKVLADTIMRRALKDLGSAWENVVPLEFETVSVETNAQFVQIVPNNDTVILVLFEVHLGEHQGAMSLCIPYVLIKPIVQKLNAQRWFAMGVRKATPQMAKQMAIRLRETTRVPCVARLGTSHITVGKLDRLVVGDVVPLTIPLSMRGVPTEEDDAPHLGRAEVVIGNQPKFRGRIGVCRGNRLAIQIEEVVSPPPQLVSHKEFA